MLEAMKIDRIELREVRLMMKYAFETSFGVEQLKRALLVTVHSDGLTGIGEVSCGEAPGYGEGVPLSGAARTGETATP